MSSRLSLPVSLFALAALSACTKGGADDTGEPVNEAPSAPAVAIEAGEARTLDDLVASITTESEDPEGDEVTYTWSWTKDGAAAGSEATVAAADTAKGQVWQVSVVASDGESDSEPATAEVTIGNTPPLETSVTLSAPEVYTDDILSAAAEGQDPDGDALTWTYQWFVDGEAAHEGPDLDGAAAFDKGQEIYVIATANDGEADGPGQQSDAVVVLNSLPGAPAVSITPDEPNEGVDDIKCWIDAESEDADGDTVSYTASWTVDGAAYTGPAETHEFTDNNISAENHFYREVWECTVWTHDGEADGETATASVVITRPDLVVDGAEHDLTEGEYLYDQVSLINGATLTVTGHVLIEAGTFELDATSVIDGTGGGEAGGVGAAGDGTGGGGYANLEAGAGGGYGGAGGAGGADSTPAAGGASYGDASTQDILVGSGGGSGGSTSGTFLAAVGGSGGAAVEIWAQDLTVAGEIWMDGADGVSDSGTSDRSGGGGSGGGILLVGDTVDVSGLLSADGGGGGVGVEAYEDDGGGGGGGRIKVYYDTGYSFTGAYSVLGGAVGTNASPVAGTPGSTTETQQTYAP